MTLLLNFFFTLLVSLSTLQASTTDDGSDCSSGLSQKFSHLRKTFLKTHKDDGFKDTLQAVSKLASKERFTNDVVFLAQIGQILSKKPIWKDNSFENELFIKTDILDILKESNHIDSFLTVLFILQYIIESKPLDFVTNEEFLSLYFKKINESASSLIENLDEIDSIEEKFFHFSNRFEILTYLFFLRSVLDNHIETLGLRTENLPCFESELKEIEKNVLRQFSLILDLIDDEMKTHKDSIKTSVVTSINSLNYLGKNMEILTKKSLNTLVGRLEKLKDRKE